MCLAAMCCLRRKGSLRIIRACRPRYATTKVPHYPKLASERPANKYIDCPERRARVELLIQKYSAR